MRIVERVKINNGDAVTQWLAGCIGAMITTLPCFIVMPIWLIFIHNYRIVDRDGHDDDVACGMICFVAGVICWLLAILIWQV
jgi:hypothetical protein